jgi:hypothetical protein
MVHSDNSLWTCRQDISFCIRPVVQQPLRHSPHKVARYLHGYSNNINNNNVQSESTYGTSHVFNINFQNLHKCNGIDFPD